MDWYAVIEALQAEAKKAYSESMELTKRSLPGEPTRSMELIIVDLVGAITKANTADLLRSIAGALIQGLNSGQRQ